MREEEAAEFKAATADDKAAKTLVDSAKAVIADFYKANKLMLTQRQKQPVVTAGEAPPPPPPTWEKPYGGKTEETTGIVAVLGMISEDIAKDMAHAKKNED